MALEITDSNFEELAAQGKPIVLDFWATWCGPCKKIAPDIEALAEEFEGQVIVGKCDVDDNDELTNKLELLPNQPLLIKSRLCFNYSKISITHFINLKT